MKDSIPELSAAVAHKISVAQMLAFWVLLTLSAVDNSYTVAADRAHDGNPLPLWKPMVWEFSSHLLIWLLIPVLGWWLAKFPLGREGWWQSLPAHVIATIPFSIGQRQAWFCCENSSTSFGNACRASSQLGQNA